MCVAMRKDLPHVYQIMSDYQTGRYVGVQCDVCENAIVDHVEIPEYGDQKRHTKYAVNGFHHRKSIKP